MKKILSSIAALAAAAMMLPLAAQADVVALQPLAVSSYSPLSCFDFTSTLKLGSKGYAVRGLQFALIHEGATISPVEYGIFGQDTLTAVEAFQAKYASTILPDGSAPTGLVGKMTRTKLNALYGCVVANPYVLPTTVSLNIKNVSLDNNGVTGVFCNQSPTDIPAFPIRVRVNGIIRDFNEGGALKAGTCDTATIPYSVWGLTYDPGSIFSVITSIDPNGMYKTAQNTFPLTATTTFSVPAVQGSQLSVRGISLKSTGLQATLCNFGTKDLTSYPVSVTVNGTAVMFDVPQLYTHGQCQSINWTYDKFGLPATPPSGTSVTATVNIDPNNTITGENKLDDSATIFGNI